MFERILLPLDGSQLAEVAIPYAEELAGRLDSDVILLHACPSQHQAVSHMHELYLKGMVSIIQREVKKKFPKCKGGRVSTEVFVGEPADIICNYVQQNEIELIVMATHGASGLKVWMLGSVVDKVVRAANVPILVVRAREDQPIEGKKRLISRILLPLDGSDASKTAVPYAVDLAKRLKASIILYQMAERAYPYYAGELSPVDWVRINAAEEKQVRANLTDMERILRREGIPVTHVVTLGTDPAAELLEQGGKTKADLVVMSTRGRSPIVRWVFGSVAEKVLRDGDLPLLLTRQASD